MLFFDEFISALFLIPYFGWGIYALRIRYRYHEELSPWVEAITLVAVLLFMVVELYMLRQTMAAMPVLYIFTALGLFVASTALYGHMLVSLASQLFVDVVLPEDKSGLNTPQFAPVEALERVGDYEGAVQESLVLARVYPKDPAVALRIARNLVELDRLDEACEWFERGIGGLTDPERALHVVNRVVDIYLKNLDRREDAVRVLELYVKTFPGGERTALVEGRLKRLEEQNALAATGPVVPRARLSE